LLGQTSRERAGCTEYGYRVEESQGADRLLDLDEFLVVN
jgi:hypothetical protein